MFSLVIWGTVQGVLIVLTHKWKQQIEHPLDRAQLPTLYTRIQGNHPTVSLYVIPRVTVQWLQCGSVCLCTSMLLLWTWDSAVGSGSYQLMGAVSW